MKIKILKQNLIGTNWKNVRKEENKIIADHYGELYYAIGNGRTNCYKGNTTCILFPSTLIVENLYDYGFDQFAFIKKELSFQPLNLE